MGEVSYFIFKDLVLINLLSNYTIETIIAINSYNYYNIFISLLLL